MKLLKILVLPILLLVGTYISFELNEFSSYKTAKTPSTDTAFNISNVMQTMKEISQRPHPLGSQENARIRAYIVQKLQSFGIETSLQETEIVSGNMLARVSNIIAQLNGVNADNKALMLMTHYDSVANSNGANDAGYAVATLIETMRVIAQQGTQKNNIILLISDGEEDGLLGAKAFMQQHPLAESIGMVLNFEARGNKGPVLMFESSSNNNKLIQQFSAAAPKPIADSLFSSIYKLMPNNTDFSITKSADISGLNFAFIDGKYAYHSAKDSIDNVSEQTIRHAASYALSLTEHFANTDLPVSADSEAIFFNLLNSYFMSYSFTIAYLLLFIAIVLVVVLKRQLSNNNKQTVNWLKGMVVVFLQWILNIGLATLLMSVIINMLGLNYYQQTASGNYILVGLLVLALALQSLWINMENGQLRLKGLVIIFILVVGLSILSGLDIVVALIVGLLISGLIFVLVKIKVNRHFMQFYHISAWLLLALVTTILMPQVSHVFVLPILFLLIVEVIKNSYFKDVAFLSIIGVVLAWLMWMSYIYFFFIGIGDMAPGLVTLMGAMLLGLIYPYIFLHVKQIGYWSFTAYFAVALVILASPAIMSPFNSDTPKPNEVFYLLDENKGEAYWASADRQLDDWSSGMLGGDNLQRVDNPVYQGSGKKYWLAPAQKLAISDLQIAKISDEKTHDSRQIKLSISSLLKVEKMYLQIADADKVTLVKINSHTMTLNNKRNDWLRISYLGEHHKPLMIEINSSSGQPIKLNVVAIKNQWPQGVVENIPLRPAYLMPRPYSLSDSIVVRKEFEF